MNFEKSAYKKQSKRQEGKQGRGSREYWKTDDISWLSQKKDGQVVESCHWHLDVTFREDGNYTLEKQASYNLNIMRKLSLNIIKLIEVGRKSLSLKKKRFAIGTNPEKHLGQIMNMQNFGQIYGVDCNAHLCVCRVTAFTTNA